MKRSTRSPASGESLLAVIDIGSNSGHVVVARVDEDGIVEVVSDARAPLRLIRDLDLSGRLKPEAIKRTLATAADFLRLAQGAGATRIFAFATAAVREAANADELISAFRRDLGLTLEVIDGRREASFAFTGAVHGLPVGSGAVLDIGGGSLEVCRFHERRMLESWSLPLGALRMSRKYLALDPPAPGQIRKLRAFVTRQLETAGVRPLSRRETLVGTGGTVRNLAKMDVRPRGYPIPRLHGYVVRRSRLQDLGVLLTSRRLSSRRSLPGLNGDRADSIVGGCLVVEAVMDFLGARELQVAGQGVREGVVLDLLGLGPGSMRRVRRSSVLRLTARLAPSSAERGERRSAIAGFLLRKLLPRGREDQSELLQHAARLLDLGRSIDYYRRHDHAAMILRSANLLGFSHRELALLSAMIEAADCKNVSWKRYRPLVREADARRIARCGVILALSDEIEQRFPPDQVPRLRCEIDAKTVRLRSPVLARWEPRLVADRFHSAFGKELLVGKPG